MTRQERGVTVLEIVRAWEPPAMPHCSNCRHALVSGTPDAPQASCSEGHGKGQRVDLWRLIRRFSPRGFRSALTCSDFQSMSDEDAP